LGPGERNFYQLPCLGEPCIEVETEKGTDRSKEKNEIHGRIKGHHRDRETLVEENEKLQTLKMVAILSPLFSIIQ
jgi:hypothetical protein